MNEGARWSYKEFRSYDEAELTLEVTHLFHKLTPDTLIQGDRSVQVHTKFVHSGRVGFFSSAGRE